MKTLHDYLSIVHVCPLDKSARVHYTPIMNCTSCGAGIVAGEPVESCDHGLKCEDCCGLNAECPQCAKLDEAIRTPESPERKAYIAKVMNGRKDPPIGAFIPGTLPDNAPRPPARFLCGFYAESRQESLAASSGVKYIPIDRAGSVSEDRPA